MGCSNSRRMSQSRLTNRSATSPAFARSPSAITSILAEVSGTSCQGNPCANETESTPSSRSAAWNSATMVFIGSLGVRHLLTMCRSRTSITGFTSPASAPAQMSKSSAARSPTSMCGYSLNRTSASAFSTILEVIEQCRSSSPPTITSGPTISRTRASRSPSQSS